MPTCTRCKADKPASEFYPARTRYKRDGLRSQCKECCRFMARQKPKGTDRFPYAPKTKREAFERYLPNSRNPKDCWEWAGAKYSSGYGRGFFNGDFYVHRASYEIFVGEIPDGIFVCHNCHPNPDNKLCVNPAHLFLGTNQDNILDALGKGVKIGSRNESHWKAKLTNTQVQELRQRYSTGKFSQKELAEMYGVAANTVNYIVKRKTWQI